MQPILRHARRETLRRREIGLECRERAVVDADEMRVERERAIKLGFVMHFD